MEIPEPHSNLLSYIIWEYILRTHTHTQTLYPKQKQTTKIIKQETEKQTEKHPPKQKCQNHESKHIMEYYFHNKHSIKLAK